MAPLDRAETLIHCFADFMWSTPTVVLLVGGGLFLTVYSRLRVFRYFGHGDPDPGLDTAAGTTGQRRTSRVNVIEPEEWRFRP